MSHEEELDLGTGPGQGPSQKPVADFGSPTDDILQKILTTPDDQLIPWEEATLPSKGIYYEGWTDGICKIRAMNQKAEKILASQRMAASGEAIDYLFRECCQFQGNLDPADLLIGDRAFLLYYLRGITHGNMYEFMITCPSPTCGSTSSHVYDLNMLAETIRYADPALGQEPFRVPLPFMSERFNQQIWVGVRFLRATDTNQMVAQRKMRKKAFGGSTVRNRRQRMTGPKQSQSIHDLADSMLDENLEKIIVSVMGDTDINTKRAFIKKLHAKDTASIREWLREHTPGIDNVVEITCPDCEQEFTMELPITEGFFRPSK